MGDDKINQAQSQNGVKTGHFFNFSFLFLLDTSKMGFSATRFLLSTDLIFPFDPDRFLSIDNDLSSNRDLDCSFQALLRALRTELLLASDLRLDLRLLYWALQFCSYYLICFLTLRFLGFWWLKMRLTLSEQPTPSIQQSIASMRTTSMILQSRLRSSCSTSLRVIFFYSTRSFDSFLINLTVFFFILRRRSRLPISTACTSRKQSCEQGSSDSTCFWQHCSSTPSSEVGFPKVNNTFMILLFMMLISFSWLPFWKVKGMLIGENYSWSGGSLHSALLNF